VKDTTCGFCTIAKMNMQQDWQLIRNQLISGLNQDVRRMWAYWHHILLSYTGGRTWRKATDEASDRIWSPL